MKNKQKIGRCLNQKSFKHYTTRVEHLDFDIVKEGLFNGTEDMNIQFNLMFASTVVDIFEEILIFDEISLLSRIIRWFLRTFYRFLILWVRYNFSVYDCGQNVWTRAPP